MGRMKLALKRRVRMHENDVDVAAGDRGNDRKNVERERGFRKEEGGRKGPWLPLGQVVPAEHVKSVAQLCDPCLEVTFSLSCMGCTAILPSPPNGCSRLPEQRAQRTCCLAGLRYAVLTVLDGPGSTTCFLL